MERGDIIIFSSLTYASMTELGTNSAARAKDGWDGGLTVQDSPFIYPHCGRTSHSARDVAQSLVQDRADVIKNI